MNRIKLHRLLTLLRKRRKITFTQLVEQMQANGVVIDYDEFQRRYTRKDRLNRETVLDSAEIVHIIQAFITTERGVDTTFCTAFEAVLMAEWSGTGLATLKRVHSIYGIHTIERATRYFYELDEDSFDYFDGSVHDSINANQKTPTVVSSNPYDLNLKPYVKRKVNVTDANVEKENIKFPENWYQMSLSDQVFKINQLVLKNGKYALAEKLIDSIIDQATNPKEQLCDLLHYRGIIKTNMGAFDEADNILNQALELANETQRPRILANLSNNAQIKGDSDQAIAYIVEGLKHAKEPVVRIYLETTLGTLFLTTAKLHHAREHYHNALEEAKQAKLMERQIYLLMNLAILDYDDNEFVSARQNIDHALQVYKQTGVQLQPDLYIRLHWNHAAISGYWDNYIGAIEQLHRIYREAEHLGFMATCTRIDIEIAKLHLCYGNEDIALQLFQSIAQSLFEDENSISEHRMKVIYGTALSVIEGSVNYSMSKILPAVKENLSIQWFEWLSEQVSLESLLDDSQSYFSGGIGQRLESEPFELTMKVIRMILAESKSSSRPPA